MSRAIAALLGASVSAVRPRVSARMVRKAKARAARAMDAPDELRKVACCPKCLGWWPSTAERNAHRAAEHKESP